MKRIFSILLTILLVMGLSVGVLGENHSNSDDVGALTYEELNQWKNALLEKVEKEELLNDPTQTQGGIDGVYSYVYPSATLYYNTPTLTSESQLISLETSGEETKLPREILIGDTLNNLLKAYANENPSLKGNKVFAVLYANNNFPNEYLWGRVTRNGQDIYGVEFTVHHKLNNGEYTYAGVYYNIYEGIITSMSAFGLNKTISLAEAEEYIDEIDKIKEDTSYFAYPTSMIGSELEPFNREDLMFGQVDFLGLTSQNAKEILGEPTFDEMIPDGENWMEVLQWEGLEVVFTYDQNKNFLGIDSIGINGGTEGPRGVKAGDSLISVIRRFKFGEEELKENSLLLYGEVDGKEYGLVKYDNDADATIRYVTTLTENENGQEESIMLYLSFHEGFLVDILISSI